MATETDFEVVAELRERPGPGNIAMTPDGRIIVSQHQFYSPDFRVVEVLPGGVRRPFPSDRWSRDVGADGIGLGAVLGLRCDPEGVVWMLDNGRSAPPKIVAWDTRSDRLHRVIYLPAPVTIPGSFHNDLAVDPVHDAIYIADIAHRLKTQHSSSSIRGPDLPGVFCRNTPAPPPRTCPWKSRDARCARAAATTRPASLGSAST